MNEEKITKLLAQLEEVNLMLQRAKLTCDQAEAQLKFTLSHTWEVIDRD